MTDDDGAPILSPNTLHPLLDGLADADLEHPIYLNRDPRSIDPNSDNLIRASNIEGYSVADRSRLAQLQLLQLAQQLLSTVNLMRAHAAYLSSTAVAMDVQACGARADFLFAVRCGIQRYKPIILQLQCIRSDPSVRRWSRAQYLAQNLQCLAP